MKYEKYLKPITYQTVADSSRSRIIINTDYASMMEKHGLTTFEALWSFSNGTIIKQKDERTVYKIRLNSNSGIGENHGDSTNDGEIFFLKKHQQHLGVLQRILLFFYHVSSRSEGTKEFYNYCEFRSKGLATPVPLASGIRFTSFFKVESFLITKNFAPLIDLEDIVLNQPEFLLGTINNKRKHNILRAIAHYARKMHASGLNHKDFNATHLLLQDIDAEQPLVALFDLQRIDKNIFNRFRWPIKSLAELFYTLPSTIFSETDRYFVFTEYKGTSRLSWHAKMQYRWILKKMARIARHCRKRNLSPKMKEG